MQVNAAKSSVLALAATHDSGVSRQTGAHKDKLANYVEIDFPEVTSKKAMAIMRSKELSVVLGNPSDIHVAQGGTALHTPTYHLLPADLRLSPSVTLDNLLASPTTDSTTKPILSPSLPTLLLFECVLVYMSPSHSSALLQWFAGYFSSSQDGAALGSIVYEMFGLKDAFGRVMVNNLKRRDVSLPGAEPYPTVDSLLCRFLDTGFTSARALTLREIRQKYISGEELDRVSKLEMLDEVEELELVLGHYAVSLGVLVSSHNSGTKWDDWGLKPSREL